MEKFKKVYIRTYGCKQNFADSEKVIGLLMTLGYVPADTPDEADLILLNTCAVRENAEQRVFGNVGALKKLKTQKPGLLLVLAGCMSQQPHMAEHFKNKFPFIDAIIGTDIISALPSIIGAEPIPSEDIKPYREGKYSANVPVMNGCDNFCTYCVVPLVRGRETSRAPENIIAEVKGLIAENRRDILLLGQNVNSYKPDFTELLRELDVLPGEFIISYMTNHPRDLTKEFIDFIAESRNISRHLHLPVQAGSNRILSLMNRGYTRERYIELAEYAGSRIPDISLTTDILVGFPGETYDDFKQTLGLVRHIGFDSAFTFIYSRREGTAAASMDDPVTADEKSAWFKELLDVQNSIGEQSYTRFIGQTMRVLCLGEGRSDTALLTGKTKQGIIIDFAGGDENLHGQFVNVKIIRVLPWALIGEVTDETS